MKSLTIILTKAGLLSALLLLTACSSTSVKETQYSGFLSDYSQLQYSEINNAYRWVDEDRVRDYYAIVMDEVLVHPSDQLNTALAEQITHYLEQRFSQKLRARHRLTREANSGVLRLRTAITGVSKQVEGMQAYEIIPIAAIYKGVQAAFGERKSYIDVRLEAELIDSQSGEVIAALIERAVTDTDKRSGDMFGFTDTQPTLDDWARRLDSFVDEYIK